MRKVLIANRGEIAVRIIRSCRELGLATVAVYSEADADALHVRRADEAVAIGKPPAHASYLNVAALLEAATRTGADAVHPGYGFLSESARFAEACRRQGLTFVGPSAQALEQMGDKSVARGLARAAGVPTVPGADHVTDARSASAAAAKLGYPVLVKAAAGGGGRGIHVARSDAELAEALRMAEREARAAFGDKALYLEKLLEGARHVEVQVLGDHHGNVVHLYDRDCSLQRRRQKLIEEGPSPALSPGQRQAMAAAAVGLAASVGYAGAGTVEFLVDRAGGFHFIEMNTRLQVEHAVTEAITGLDLVRAQLLIAAGEPLGMRQEDVPLSGNAIEFRINAEDPDNGFMPCPGRITAVELPGGPGVRVDTAVYAGSDVVPFYDSLVAKVIVWAPDREQAIRRGRRALQELRLEGVKTTTPLHLRLLDDERVRRGEVHTGYLEELLDRGETAPAGRPPSEAAVRVEI
ncbi:MAG: acetyl-CoA carboxylase, biotin carboxylase subunit [Baekduia sp.]|nr:acetyl-CoA carboxylase, biotin carboxylase subunit [Baekduia sp.]